MKSFYKLLFVVFFCFFIGACRIQLQSSLTPFNQASVGTDFAPSDDAELLYIDLDVDAYESNNELVPYYEISTTEQYGDSISRESPSNCEIEYRDSSEEDASTDTLVCILDIMESEFIVKDFHLIYNFPEGMCEYVDIALPWHFNYKTVHGPQVKEKTSEGDGDSEDSEESTTKYCADIGIRGEEICEDEEELLCRKLTGDDEGPLCCAKGRKAGDEEWEPDPSCFGGPGTVVQNFGIDFKDILRDFLPEGGLRRTLSFSKLGIIEGNNNSSIFHANYLKRLDRSAKSLKNVDRNDLGPSFESSAGFTPRLFYTFSCLDGAGEVLHQILLMVREWNTHEEFIAFYDSGGENEGDPDITGIEGKNCAYEDRSVLRDEGTLCNDLYDLDDYSSGFPRLDTGLDSSKSE